MCAHTGCHGKNKSTLNILHFWWNEIPMNAWNNRTNALYKFLYTKFFFYNWLNILIVKLFFWMLRTSNYLCQKVFYIPFKMWNTECFYNSHNERKFLINEFQIASNKGTFLDVTIQQYKLQTINQEYIYIYTHIYISNYVIFSLARFHKPPSSVLLFDITLCTQILLYTRTDRISRWVFRIIPGDIIWGFISWNHGGLAGWFLPS